MAATEIQYAMEPALIIAFSGIAGSLVTILAPHPDEDLVRAARSREDAILDANLMVDTASQRTCAVLYSICAFLYVLAAVLALPLIGATPLANPDAYATRFWFAFADFGLLAIVGAGTLYLFAATTVVMGICFSDFYEMVTLRLRELVGG